MRAAIAALAVLLGGALPAEAHAFLDSAVPAVGSTVAASPAAVTIHFTEELEPAFSTIAVTDAAGHDVTSGPARVPGGEASVFAVGLRPLPPGTYQVVWHVTSVDTHRTMGRFAFTVAGAPR